MLNFMFDFRFYPMGAKNVGHNGNQSSRFNMLLKFATNSSICFKSFGIKF